MTALMTAFMKKFFSTFPVTQSLLRDIMKIFTQRLLISSSLSFVLAAFCITSFAQFSGGMGGGHRSRDSSSAASAAHATTAPADRTAQMSDKLYDLRMRLLVTPAQSEAWNDFHAKVWAWSEESLRGRVATASSEQSALQAMQFRLGQTQSRYALMESLSDSVKKLYAVLSPEQQRIADQYLPPIIP